MDDKALETFITKKYDDNIVESLSDFIRIPNVSFFCFVVSPERTKKIQRKESSFFFSSRLFFLNFKNQPFFGLSYLCAQGLAPTPSNREKQIEIKTNKPQLGFSSLWPGLGYQRPRKGTRAAGVSLASKYLTTKFARKHHKSAPLNTCWRMPKLKTLSVLKPSCCSSRVSPASSTSTFRPSTAQSRTIRPCSRVRLFVYFFEMMNSSLINNIWYLTFISNFDFVVDI